MTRFLKKVLVKTGLYEKVKYSFPARVFFYVFRPKQRKKVTKELAFYRSFLPAVSLIFDIGANDGHKTHIFSTIAKKVIACEPDPHNLEILTARFGKKKNIIIEPHALSEKKGTADMYIHYSGSALNTLNPKWKSILEKDDNKRWPEKVVFTGTNIKVNTTTLDALIDQYGIPDMIKIDVEGYEKNVLYGLTHPVKFISFEVLLPEFLNDAMACLEWLHQLSTDTLFNYAVDESLVLEQFTSYTDFRKVLSGLTIAHLEVIAASGSSGH